MQNMPLGLSVGPALGVGIGVIIGGLNEQRNQHRIRPLTAKEKKYKRFSIWIGAVAVGLLGLLLIGAIIAK